MRLFAPRRTYLDWAASAPALPEAARAFTRTLSLYGNPSSPHEEGVAAKRLLEAARTTIARQLEARPSGIVFTSGATEANNLGVLGYVEALSRKGRAKSDLHVLYLPSAHASVISTIEEMERQGVNVEALQVRDGCIDLERLVSQLTSKTCLVVVDAVCGETGTVWDVRGVRTALDAFQQKEKSDRIVLHVDASQAPLALPVSLTRFAADMLTLDAQKIGGVRGSGILARRPWIALAPLMHGGGQEGGLRPGTESVALASATATAFVKTQKGCEAFNARARLLRTEFLTRLRAEVPDVVSTQGKEGIPHILNLSFPGRDTDYAVMLLDRAGFAVSTRSACETDADTGSRAVLLLTGDEKIARSTLRISWGPTTTRRDLFRLLNPLLQTIRFLDSASVY